MTTSLRTRPLQRAGPALGSSASSNSLDPKPIKTPKGGANGDTEMIKTFFGLTMLAAESQQVIWLRWLKLAAGGPRASAEMRRMGSEKIVAAGQAMAGTLSGQSFDRTVRHYRKKVQANLRRLSR